MVKGTLRPAWELLSTGRSHGIRGRQVTLRDSCPLEAEEAWLRLDGPILIIRGMIPQFALRLIFGMSLTWCVMPQREVTSGFYRIQMLVTLGLGVLATLTLSQLESPMVATMGLYALTIGVALASFLGSVMWTLERRSAGVRYALSVLVMSAVALVFATWGRESGVPVWFDLLSELSGGWIIGGAISTMLLGHWYLTATGMKLEPLQQLNALLFAAVVLRTVLAGAVFIWAPPVEASTQWVWLALRWAGLIGPLILVLMVFRILKYRNTQSATGVLYAIDILIFLGEATAALLSRDLHCPF